MARPQFQAPTFPNQKSPSEAGTGKCGSSYHIQYEVRAPYKSADKYSNVLPVAYSGTEIGQNDIEASLEEVSKEGFHSALKDAIKGALEILQDYSKDGYIDDANRAVIIKMVNRANNYQSQAKEIRDWWETKYQPDSAVAVYGWPLTKDNVQGCTSWAPNTGGVYVGGSGGATALEFTCPTTADRDLHDADRLAYQQLLYAAMLNARCAQEAAATVGTYNRNKEFLEGLSGGMGLAKAPPKKTPGGTITTKVPPTSEHPEDPEPEIDLEPETSKPKKKKDNTLLLAGAAGLGLLILKGRK